MRGEGRRRRRRTARRAAARSPGVSRAASMKPLPPSARRISTSPCCGHQIQRLHRTERGHVAGGQIGVARTVVPPQHGIAAGRQHVMGRRTACRSPPAGGAGGGLAADAEARTARMTGPGVCGGGRLNCTAAMIAARQNSPPRPAHTVIGRSDRRGPRARGSATGCGMCGTTSGASSAVVGGAAAGIAQDVVGLPSTR